MKKDGLDERAGARSGWTSVEDYIVALARRRTERRKRERRRPTRMDPDDPRITLGTVPFLLMMAAFAVLFVAIAMLAWPVHEVPRKKPVAHELGTAPPGWLEEAEQEMKNS